MNAEGDFIPLVAGNEREITWVHPALADFPHIRAMLRPHGMSQSHWRAVLKARQPQTVSDPHANP